MGRAIKDGHYENIHLFQPWWEKIRGANEVGAGHIEMFGIQAMNNYCNEFHHNQMHLAQPYDRNYQPNPFAYQYDFMMHVFLNYKQIYEKEIELIKHHIDNNLKKSRKAREYLDFMQATKKLGGLTRQEYLFAAAELRWPTEVDSIIGSLTGDMVRDPWVERRVNAAVGGRDYNISFGGSGQGKTTWYLGFMLMVYEHFLYTQRGAKCTFTTVNEDKLRSVGWAYISRLHNSSMKEMSLYAGKSVIAGDYTIKRPNSKDTGGVIRGMLAGMNIKQQSVVDKMTGAHDHEAVINLIDELQSSSDAPIIASTNSTMRAKRKWIFAAGNYGENDDPLARNIVPEHGWETVDVHTGTWNSRTVNGQPATVLHFNNDDSPGMSELGAKLYPHMPNRAMLEEKFPNVSSRNLDDPNYRRFWVGFRVENLNSKAIITDEMVKNNGADNYPLFIETIHRFASFDNAPAGRDRNPLGIFEYGVDGRTGTKKFGPIEIYKLTPPKDVLTYYQVSTDEIDRTCKAHGVKDIIMDFTNRTSHVELLRARGYNVYPLIYQQGIADGVRVNPITKRVDKKILIDPSNNIYAHEQVDSQICLGAYCLQKYITHEKMVGINNNLLKHFHGNCKSLSEELYMRNFVDRTLKAYGEIKSMDDKKLFKKKNGFSPDILDLLFQAAFYMMVYQRFYFDDEVKINIKRAVKDEEEIEEDQENDIWTMDLIGNE